MRLGFMDLEGKIYDCLSYEHMDKAEDICNSLDYVNDCNEKFGVLGIHFEDYLKYRGWLEIHSRSAGHGCTGYRLKDGSTHACHLTDRQKEYISGILSEASNEDQYFGFKCLLDMNEILDEVAINRDWIIDKW